MDVGSPKSSFSSTEELKELSDHELWRVAVRAGLDPQSETISHITEDFRQLPNLGKSAVLQEIYRRLGGALETDPEGWKREQNWKVATDRLKKLERKHVELERLKPVIESVKTVNKVDDFAKVPLDEEKAVNQHQENVGSKYEQIGLSPEKQKDLEVHSNIVSHLEVSHAGKISQPVLQTTASGQQKSKVITQTEENPVVKAEWEKMEKHAKMGGRSFRHDTFAWAKDKFVGPFKNYGQRMFGGWGVRWFGGGEVSDQIVESQEATRVEAEPLEVQAFSEVQKPSVVSESQIGVVEDGRGQKNTTDVKQKKSRRFGPFLKGAQTKNSKPENKIGLPGPSGKISQAKDFLKTGVTAAQALAGNPKAIFSLAKMALRGDLYHTGVNFLKNVGTKVAIGGGFLLLWALSNLTGVFGAALGAIMGITFFASAPVFLAAGAGAVLGFTLGQVIGNMLVGGGVTGSGLLSGVAASVQGLWGTVSSVGTVTVVGYGSIGVVAVSMVLTFLDQTRIQQAFLAEASDGPKIVKVEKTADRTILPNDPKKEKVVYTIKVSTESETDVEISIDDTQLQISPENSAIKLQMPGLSDVVPKPEGELVLPKTVNKANPVTIVYQPLIIDGPQFNNSVVKNTVKVKATTIDGVFQETTAEANVMIGENFDPPWGYPATGAILSLDDEPLEDGYGIFHNHSGFGKDGGLDISPRSGDFNVYSTTTGKVIESRFDSERGGIVRIQSGNYIAAYQHMADEGRPENGSLVVRGQSLGFIHPTKLPITTGPHLHYQVFKNGVNLFFSSSKQNQVGQNNAGPCMINGVRTSFIQPIPAISAKPYNVIMNTSCTESANGIVPVSDLPACTMATGSNLCSVESLRGRFSGFSEEQLKTASQICTRESGGNPNALLKGCDDNGNPKFINGVDISKSYDVGLFQIGMFSHCPGAFKPGATNTCPNNVLSQSVLDACVAKAKDPNQIYNWVRELSSNGTSWGPWNPNDKLEKCSINYLPK